jgi:type IV pilus assembly protein PilE
MNSKSFQHGFTLIEVMIVVVIVAILAAIALPSYERYVLQAHRSAAQSFVSQVAMKEEEYFAHMRSYTDTIGSGANGLKLAPPASEADFYTFEACTSDCNGLTAPANGYIVYARRSGRQLNDSVGDVVLYSTGAKCTVTGTDPKWGNRTC